MTMPSTITTNSDAAIAQPTPVRPMIVFPDRSDVPSAASELKAINPSGIETIERWRLIVMTLPVFTGFQHDS